MILVSGVGGDKFLNDLLIFTIMNIHQAVEFVESSDKFKDFIKKRHGSYLAHVFCMFDKEDQSPWQVGFYDEKSDKITSFTAGEEVLQSEEEDAFKKEGVVEKLDLDKVKIDFDDALKSARDIHKKEHSAEILTKTIVILQSMDSRIIWNITLITHAFTIINVRVDAVSGEVKVEKSSVLNLGKRV